MKTPGRPATVSRRNLVRALLGREIPPADPKPGQPPANPHAAGDAAWVLIPPIAAMIFMSQVKDPVRTLMAMDEGNGKRKSF